ncbi:lysophospholipid acyltransferase family protein [Gynuella sp.]|uniref:lysophospholipid acyltransferase family protein n=1 Tax=Gynuella sp. TaxID=2969146 RepID=UPI003D0CA847
MGLVRFAIKSPLLVVWCLLGLLLSITTVPWLAETSILKLAGWWHRNLLRILRVRVRVVGTPGALSGLMVSNHISWLDIIVLGSRFHTYFVSKAEVAKWPVVGTLARSAGTLFLPRGGDQSAAISRAMADRVSKGSYVLFFPEGTTYAGTEVHRFHPRLFAAAIESGVPVLPVALFYLHEPQPHPTVPYLGDQSLAANLWGLLQTPAIDVVIQVGHAIPAAAKQRKELAQEAQQQVTSLLQTTIADHS